MIITCSMGLMIFTDYWSTPVIVNQDKDENPPPRLAVVGKDSEGTSHIYLYSTSFVGSEGELTLLSRNKMDFESPVDFHSAASTNG